MELEDLEGMAELAQFAGGSVASANLKACIKFIDRINTADEIDRLNKLIIIWTNALRRHNDQDKTFCDYDLETGEPVKRVKSDKESKK